MCNALRRTETPVVLQVATLVAIERMDANTGLRGFEKVYRRLMTRVTARIDERGLRVPTVVLVENRLMFEVCRNRGLAARVELTPPGVDCEVFRPDPGTDRSGYVLFVARLDDARKNVAGLVRAFSQARANAGIAQTLVLAGFRPPSEDVLSLIDRLGLRPVVEVRSPVSATELVGLYQGADFFASATFEEGLGLTYLEAMSCGLPIVSTNNAGAEFILTGSGAGSIVPFSENFVDRFADEIVRWCNDAGLRKVAGENARELVMSRFSTQVASVFVEAIESVR